MIVLATIPCSAHSSSGAGGDLPRGDRARDQGDRPDGVGGLVIGMVDNLLRPRLVGGRTQMHELLIFFSVMAACRCSACSHPARPVVVALGLAMFDAFRAIPRTAPVSRRPARAPDPQRRSPPPRREPALRRRPAVSSSGSRSSVARLPSRAKVRSERLPAWKPRRPGRRGRRSGAPEDDEQRVDEVRGRRRQVRVRAARPVVEQRVLVHRLEAIAHQLSKATARARWRVVAVEAGPALVVDDAPQPTTMTPRLRSVVSARRMSRSSTGVVAIGSDSWTTGDRATGT